MTITFAEDIMFFGKLMCMTVPAKSVLVSTNVFEDIISTVDYTVDRWGNGIIYNRKRNDVAFGRLEPIGYHLRKTNQYFLHPDFVKAIKLEYVEAIGE